MKVLVTGAAGFIGGALSLELARRGDLVLGIDNINPYYDVELKYARLNRLKDFRNFEFQKVDIVDCEKINKCFKTFKPDRVVHLAAQAGVRYSLVNPQAYID